MNNKIQSIQFHQDTLITTMHDGKPYVAIKPICEAAGLTWGSQYNRIMRDEVLSEGIFIMKTPSNGGEQDTVFLPIMMLQGWMFGVSIKRVKPELRPKLLQYKRECYQVLHDYFTKGEAVRPKTRYQAPPKARYIATMRITDTVTGRVEDLHNETNDFMDIVKATARYMGFGASVYPLPM